MARTDNGRVLVVLLAAVVISVEIGLIVSRPAEAAFPGGNGKIYFESTRTGSSQIFAMNPSGSKQTNITRNRSLNQEDPAVSPNGRKVAYEYAREVWVMNSDGTGKRRVVADTGGDASPSWSPNGKRIVFSKNSADIWVVKLDGTGQRNLTNTPNQQERAPAFSPDGERIAYTVSPTSGGTQVYVMNADGSGQTNFTGEENVGCPNGGTYSHDVQSRDASWSPDGNWIAFTGAGGCAAGGSATGGLNIWRMDAVDGVPKVQLTNDENTIDELPAYAPSLAGARIAFVSRRNNDDVAFPDEIYTMDADDGSDIRRLTTNAATDRNPDWQPRR